MTIIKLENMTKYYGKTLGVENLNLEIESGEVFGFIGPNGAGKSTTIRTMMGFIKSSGGMCSLFGEPVSGKLHEIKHMIGYLPSEVSYYDDMTGGQLLNYSIKYYRGDFTERLKYLCDYFELDTSKKIEDLSYGNKKKIGIIQALAHEPKLLILDEPTGGLDPIMQNKFFDLLIKEKEKGTTIFFSSHILGEVQKLCDRVGIIKEGRLIKVETLEELSRVKYKKIKVLLKEPSTFVSPKENIKDLIIKDKMVTCLCIGGLENFLVELLKNQIENIWIEDPSLEEIFLHHYQ
ncbi:ABC transporter ATP-binding protein [Acidaminobacter sp. JC074]|uniref:ABC transporter ATP-binding protein n=1 Tax=Acidaminobacter sp. JC074 TaxID=2530199 RepID=UPI001F10F172|nr:ABC transporter ATP-binding protein [Acidaminobacter sp. JC074]MCH4887725.1 ABC transporter ATP-binding protein [Acidaminobacter sp. JC074]